MADPDLGRVGVWGHLDTFSAADARAYARRVDELGFGTLWVPDSWDQMSDDDRYVLLRHERVHLQQRKRMGDVAMAFVYLVPFFPLFLAYGRARIEWEAYIETIRATAEVYGMHDRGVLAAGKKADLNVIDLDRLQLHLPAMRYDLPAGGKRLVQTADGYDATVVAGQIIRRHGVDTGARPGALVRAGA